MSQYFEIQAARPDSRHLSVVADGLRSGAVIAYPTDSGYALGCMMGQRRPLRRIRALRQLKSKHNFTLICRDLSEISQFARVDNAAYRILKKCTPGGYTFILKATQEVPKLMLAAGKKTIGIRIPDHPLALGISETLGQPILSTTLILPEQKAPLVYAEDVIDAVGDQVDMVIDGGYCGFDPTTVIDFSEGQPIILRQGSGYADWLQSVE